MDNPSIANSSKKHHAGFIKLIGSPNVDKNTLINQLFGEKTPNTTSEMQTKSPRAMGIINGDNFQIVYSDLPDVLAPADKMQKKLIGQVEDLLQNDDIILYFIDCGETCIDAQLAKSLKGLGIPIVLVIDQIDKYTEEQVAEARARWSKIFPEADIFTVSSLTGQNIDGLRERIIALLPESPSYIPKNNSEHSTRYFIAELIREQIRLQYKKEIADSVKVVLDNYSKEEGKDLTQIKATIYVEWDTQRSIIIGSSGSAIMKLGSNTRVAVGDFLQGPCYLELNLKPLKAMRQCNDECDSSINDIIKVYYERYEFHCYKDGVCKAMWRHYSKSVDEKSEFVEAEELDLSEYDEVRVIHTYGDCYYEYSQATDIIKMGKIIVNLPSEETIEMSYVLEESVKEIEDDMNHDGGDWDATDVDIYLKEGHTTMSEEPIDEDYETEIDGVYETDILD